jgi:hypothetical protein
MDKDNGTCVLAAKINLASPGHHLRCGDLLELIWFLDC